MSIIKADKVNFSDVPSELIALHMFDNRMKTLAAEIELDLKSIKRKRKILMLHTGSFRGLMIALKLNTNKKGN